MYKVLNTSTRFDRQISLAEIGMHGQERLKKSHVLLLGAGGLGTPAALYLAAAGIGKITLVDFDSIEETNLNRQFLYTPEDIGKKKANILAEKISLLYNDIECVAKDVKITSACIEELVAIPDIIVLCVDNLETRLLVNDYCLKHAIALVDAGVDGFYGYLFYMDSKNKDAPCLSCLQKSSLNEKEKVPAIGAVCGIIGSMQALCCIQILLGMSNPYKNNILYYDAKLAEFEKITIMKNSTCRLHS